MNAASQTKVLEAAETYSLAAFLTGHVHWFDEIERDTQPRALRKVWELRSASAVQGPHDRAKPKPGFSVHRLRLDAGGVQWRVWRYEWSLANGRFELSANPNHAAKVWADFKVP